MIATSPDRPLHWDASINALREILDPQIDIYLVGGAVRDAYLHRSLHDIDLATPGDGRSLARHIANAFGGAYYALDRARGVGRALIPWQDHQLTVDVAQFRGTDLLTDLRKRDFTINAMAVRLTGDLQTVYDPTGGLNDLAAKRLRHCTPNAIPDDPVRGLRAVRASMSFNLTIEATTRDSIKAHAAALSTISAERLRDEFFQILETDKPAAALTALHHLGLLAFIAPEVAAMQHVTQPPPHQFDLWPHTLRTVEYLDLLRHVLSPRRRTGRTANIQAAAVLSTLNTFREPLRAHLAHTWPDGRSHGALLLLAALLHDAGKPAARTLTAEGRIQFHQHELLGEDIAEERGYALRLSNNEVTRLMTIIRQHMRPHWLFTEHPVSRRAIYRFWRDAGPAGVDVCLLAVADYLATYGPTLDILTWTDYLQHIRALLAYYFEHPAEQIAPLALLTGQQLLDELDLTPGPQIGALLEALREAQAAGEVTTQKEALDFVQRLSSSR